MSSSVLTPSTSSRSAEHDETSPTPPTSSRSVEHDETSPTPPMSSRSAEHDETSHLSDNSSCNALGSSPGTNRKRSLDFLRSIDVVLMCAKLFYCTFYGSLGVLLAYLSVFLKQLGLNADQIGVAGGVRPLVGMFSGPLCGITGDRFRIQRALLIVSVIVYAVFAFVVYHIPEPQRVTPLPCDNLTNVSRSADDIGWLYETEGRWRVFFTVIFVLVLGELVFSPATSLADTAVLRMLGAARIHVYGQHRAWAAFGFAICAFIGGALVNNTRVQETICGTTLVFSNYSLLSYFIAAFVIIAFGAATQFTFAPRLTSEHNNKPIDAAALQINDEYDKTTLTSTKHVEADLTSRRTSQSTAPRYTVCPTVCRSDDDITSQPYSISQMAALLCNLHYASWLAACLVLGILHGFMLGFLYWHLENIGATQLLMGVDTVVQMVSEFTTWMLVRHLLKLCSPATLVCFGFLGYTVRFVIYAVIPNPWIAVPAGLLQGLTFASVWWALTYYLTIAVPPTSLASMQGILHGLYFGLGSGAGNMIGGVVIETLGSSVTFLIFAVVAAFMAAIFWPLQHFCKAPDRNGASYEKLH